MIVLYILAWLWSAPQILIGLILIPFYGPLSFEWRTGVLAVHVQRIAGFPTTTGQTWGRIVFLKNDAADLWTHERRHVTQSNCLGPLFGPAYGIASLIAAIGGADYYEGNWFERDARRAAGQE